MSPLEPMDCRIKPDNDMGGGLSSRAACVSFRRDSRNPEKGGRW